MSEQNPASDATRPVDPWSDPSSRPTDPSLQATGQGPAMPAGGPPPALPGADLEATLPLTPAVAPPAYPTPPGGWPPADPSATQPATAAWGQPPAWAQGQPPYPQGPYGPPPSGQAPYGQAPYGQAPYGTPAGGTPIPYADPGWDPDQGPQAGTAYGTRPPVPPSGTRRGGAAGGSGGSGRTPSAVIVGSVIGVAAILAVAVWFVLLRPGDNTASGTPSPGATTFLTPPPTATPEPSSFDPFETPTPEPTRFRNPTFSGLRIADAQQLAERSNVQLEVTYQVTDTVDPDTVIDQDPPAGSELLPGDVVRLTVAAPAPTVAVPDLRGFTEEDAVAALLDVDLGVGTRTEAFDADTDIGLIIRTDPRGGLQVARGTPVDYLVSLGPEPSPSPTPEPTQLPAPDLSGLTRDEAQAIADAQGFLLDVQEQETLDTEPGTVLSQDPEPDTAIRPGDTVFITVAVRPATVVVPDVRGLPEADAVSVLLDAGLEVGERFEAFDADTDAGLIIRTDPRRDLEVAPGTPVDYVVSLGAEPTPSPEPTLVPALVPALVGLPVDEAQAIADAAGLRLETEDRATLDVEPGIVLEQDPTPDTEVPSGSTIVAIVSVRPASIAVPPLRGLSEEDALAALADAALVPGERTERHHASIPAGAVIRSDPAAGTIVALDTAVDYVVSTGPEPTPTPEPTAAPIDLPELSGLALVDVQAFADESGIVLEVVDQETEDAPPDTILDQDPRPGTQLRRGDSVRITVARQPAQVAVPPLRGLSEADAVAALLDVDLVPGTVSERFHAAVPAGSVILSDPRAGVSVPRGSTVDYTLSIGPEPTPTPSPTPEPTPAPIVVPSFVGGPVSDAQAFADANGLRTDITTQETADAPPDLVLAQDPDEGGELRPGDTLRLRIATAPTTAVVPDVRGQAEADAVAVLLEAGLSIGGRQERFHGSIPEGAVIRTDPAADEVVALGTVVDLLVSKGPQPTPSPTPEPTVTPSPTPTPLVTVPDLRGQSEADGIALLTESGLTPGRRLDRFHATIPADAIIRSIPAADEQVAPGSTVDYVVSRGPEPTPTPNPAPDLVGRSRGDAQALADGAGFTLDIAERETADAPPDTVLDQDPAPGTDLDAGSTIRVTVAVEPPQVTVPALRGLSEADGIALLTDSGLTPGRRIDRFNDVIPADQIVRTDPAADEQVPAGTAVDYVVSRGPEPVPAPDLLGLPIEEAQAIADGAGLTLDITEEDDDTAPTGTVLSQDPAPGEPLTSTTIAVVTARNTALVTVPPLRGLSDSDGIALLTDSGLTPGRRIDRFNDVIPVDQIVRTDPAADEQVAPGTAVDYVVSKGPEPVEVPDVTGLPVGDAEGIARANGLTLDVTFEDSRDVPPDTVLSQDPVAGSPGDGSGTLRVRVARSPSTVEVPRLRGETESDAIGLLLDAGLEPGDRTERANATIPEGSVLSSDPRAGTEVAPGSRVDYVVSRGPAGGDQTPEPTAEPTERPTSDPGSSGDSVALVESVVPQVSALRELELTAGVPVESVTPREFRRRLKAAYESQNPPETVAAEAATLVRLGLIPPGTDLEQTRLDLMANGVVAWYDITTGVLNVVQREGALDAVVRFFAAGEADKALIDGQVDLSTWRPEDLTQTDRSVARAALLGGDMALLMIDWAGQNLSPDEQGQLPGLLPTDPALLQSAPLYLRRMQTFPTDTGRAFAEVLRGRGGWATVTDAYGRAPASTEQILHPEKYRDDRPVAVELPDLSGLLGDGWSVSDQRTLGELGIGIWLDDGVDGAPNAWAADGWGGDRLVTLDGPDGAWAVVWQTAWDSDTDADEFSGMADAAMGDLPGAHVVLRGADVTGGGLPSPSLVVVASDQSVLDTLLSGTGLGG